MQAAGALPDSARYLGWVQYCRLLRRPQRCRSVTTCTATRMARWSRFD